MTDYISREKALEIRISEGYNNDGILFIPLRDVREHLRSIPAADVAPVVHGRWIAYERKYNGASVKLDNDGCPKNSCYCSVCGDWLTASDEYPCRGRYCPNCGAIMDMEVQE